MFPAFIHSNSNTTIQRVVANLISWERKNNISHEALRTLLILIQDLFLEDEANVECPTSHQNCMKYISKYRVKHQVVYFCVKGDYIFEGAELDIKECPNCPKCHHPRRHAVTGVINTPVFRFFHLWDLLRSVLATPSKNAMLYHYKDHVPDPDNMADIQGKFTAISFLQ
jgi:hypothetical protein